MGLALTMENFQYLYYGFNCIDEFVLLEHAFLATPINVLNLTWKGHEAGFIQVPSLNPQGQDDVWAVGKDWAVEIYGLDVPKDLPVVLVPHEDKGWLDFYDFEVGDTVR